MANNTLVNILTLNNKTKTYDFSKICTILIALFGYQMELILIWIVEQRDVLFKW